MMSIRDLTDKELSEQIRNAGSDLNEAEYGTGDYNSALAELQVAIRERQRREEVSSEDLENEYDR